MVQIHTCRQNVHIHKTKMFVCLFTYLLIFISCARVWGRDCTCESEYQRSQISPAVGATDYFELPSHVLGTKFLSSAKIVHASKH